MTANISLLQALGAKMRYDSQRQQVISQNIANANTPGYRPEDLEKVDFGAVLKNITGDSAATLAPVETNPLHMAAAAIPPERAQAEAMKHTYDVTPTGNAVSMEQQMVNSSETMTDYSLMTSLYQKNINMLRTAIGVGR